MAIRAADLSNSRGLAAACRGGHRRAAERAAGCRPTAYPVATDTRVGGDDAQTRFVMDFTPEGRSAGLHAGRSLSGGDRPAAGDLQAAAQDRRERPRPGQGVPLRPGDAGRLAHRDRRQQAGADRQGLRARRRRRPAGAAGARSRRDRPRQLHAHHRAREPAGARSRPPARSSASRRTAAIRGRSSCSIRAMAASTTAPSAGERQHGKGHRAANSRTLLRDKLEKTGKYRVVMTRTDDTFIPLADRVRMARIRQARAVRLDPCRRASARRGRGAGRHRLYAVGDRLRCRGGAARREPRTAPT